MLKTPPLGTPNGEEDSSTVGTAVLLCVERQALSAALRGAPGGRWRIAAQKKLRLGNMDALLLQSTPQCYPPCWRHDLSMWRLQDCQQDEEGMIRGAAAHVQAELSGREKEILFAVSLKEVWASPCGREALCFSVQITTPSTGAIILSREESLSIQYLLRGKLEEDGAELR